MPGKGVRDVPAEAFIKAYAAHLKSNDNVCFSVIYVRHTASVSVSAAEDSPAFASRPCA